MARGIFCCSSIVCTIQNRRKLLATSNVRFACWLAERQLRLFLALTLTASRPVRRFDDSALLQQDNRNYKYYRRHRLLVITSRQSYTTQHKFSAARMIICPSPMCLGGHIVIAAEKTNHTCAHMRIRNTSETKTERRHTKIFKNQQTWAACLSEGVAKESLAMHPAECKALAPSQKQQPSSVSPRQPTHT